MSESLAVKITLQTHLKGTLYMVIIIEKDMLKIDLNFGVRNNIKIEIK